MAVLRMKNANFSGNDGILDELSKLTKQTQEQIAEAGLHGENEKIFALAERLRRTVALAQKYEGIRQEMKDLTLSGNSLSQIDNQTESAISDLPKNGSDSHKENRKERGERLRTKWITNYGKTLKWIRGALYRNNKGEVVGIACATEKLGPDGPKGRWWLGLSSGQFQSAVLLCEKSDGQIHGVCLPKSFIESHRSRFCRSKNGQEQFNILKNDLKWFMQLPTTGAIDITMYVDNPASLL